MKFPPLTIFKILVVFVLFGKILSMILNFSDATDQVLNIVMFSLIGVAYLYMAVVWQQRLLKGAIAACGLYLIAMNFFPASLPLDIIGIVCILTPMIIARTSKESKT